MNTIKIKFQVLAPLHLPSIVTRYFSPAEEFNRLEDIEITDPTRLVEDYIPRDKSNFLQLLQLVNMEFLYPCYAVRHNKSFIMVNLNDMTVTIEGEREAFFYVDDMYKLFSQFVNKKDKVNLIETSTANPPWYFSPDKIKAIHGTHGIQ